MKPAGIAEQNIGNSFQFSDLHRKLAAYFIAIHFL